MSGNRELSLASFEAWLYFVNYVKTTFATNDFAVLVSIFGRLKGVEDFHENS